MQDLIPGPWNHELSCRQTLNGLIHPGNPTLDFKSKTVVRDVEGHYILKGSIQQEDLMIVDIYALNMGAANYISQLATKLKNHIDNNTLILGDFNTPLTAMNRSSKQKINKNKSFE